MITPIETEYAGHRFRSRLEARWATFLDYLGMPWEYEPQGYLVGEKKRAYLPDFYLPKIGTWVEVKGTSDQLDLDLLVDAVHPTYGIGRPDGYGITKMLILGPVPVPRQAYMHTLITGAPSSCGSRCTASAPTFVNALFWSLPREFPAQAADVTADQVAALREMGALIEQIGRPVHAPPAGDLTAAVPNRMLRVDAMVDAALVAARSARFEHGEKP